MISNQIELEKLSWADVKTYLEQNNTALILTGATENNGPHLPLGVDNLKVYKIGKEVAESTGVLMAPVIPYGNSDVFREFPGTIVIRSEILKGLYLDVMMSLARHGFKRLVVLNGHLPNAFMLGEAAVETRRQTGALVAVIEVNNLINKFSQGLRETAPDIPSGHGGEGTTMMTLAYTPELVQMEKAPKTFPRQPLEPFKATQSITDLQFKEFGIQFYFDWHELTKTGTIGDATVAKKEKGDKVLQQVIAFLIEFIETFKQCPIPERRPLL